MLAKSALATYVGTEVTNSELVMLPFCQQRSCVTVKANRIFDIVTVKIDVKLVIESGRRSRLDFVTKSLTCTINMSYGGL